MIILYTMHTPRRRRPRRHDNKKEEEKEEEEDDQKIPSHSPPAREADTADSKN